MDDSNNQDVSYQLQVSVAIASSQEQAATVFRDTLMALTNAGYQLDVAENTIGDETVFARSPAGAAGQFPSDRSVLYFRAAGVTVMIGFTESTDMPVRDYAMTMARLIEANISLDPNPLSAE